MAPHPLALAQAEDTMPKVFAKQAAIRLPIAPCLEKASLLTRAPASEGAP